MIYQRPHPRVPSGRLSQRERGKRRGVILILVLACLAIASVLLITGIKLALSSHRVSRTFGWSVQAQWLAESGLERAAAQLAADADYSGETWKISAKDLDGDDAGTVKIDVKPVPEHDNRRLVKVETDFPDDPLDRVQYSKELTLEVK
ncbi:MAG: pilus assembly PilX N-terminal domain-containing protein [Thermoguttaceae bacterium]